jgi:hypothetical protein
MTNYSMMVLSSASITSWFLFNKRMFCKLFYNLKENLFKSVIDNIFYVKLFLIKDAFKFKNSLFSSIFYLYKPTFFSYSFFFYYYS